MLKAGASDHSPIRLAIVCCENLFSRRSFIALVLSVCVAIRREFAQASPHASHSDLRREKPVLYPRATWRLQMLMG